MNSRRICIIVLFWCVLFTSIVQGQYFYSGGGQINLKLDSTKVAIKFDSQSSRESLISSIGRILDDLDDLHTIDGFIACTLSTSTAYSNFLDSLDTITGIYLVEPYYLTSFDEPSPTGEIFVAAFDSSLTTSQIDSINDVHHTVIDRGISGMYNVFALKNTDSSGERTLDLANTYYLLPQLRYAHPDFGFHFKLHSPYKLYDFYHEEQPHMKIPFGWFNDSTVWDFAGLTDTLVVAVIDNGVEYHEDLPASRILSGIDFYSDPWTPGSIDYDPSPDSNQWHGMACAGLIAASHVADSLAGIGDMPAWNRS